MVYPASASSSIFLLVYLVGLLPYQTFATQPLWTELHAGEPCNFVTGNRSLVACSSHGSWSEPVTQQHKIPAQQLHATFSSILDNPSLNLSEKDEHFTVSKPAYGSMQVSGQVLDEYIVRFTAYKHASEHKQALQAALQLVSGWQWIDRINPASAFPTDFALLKVDVATQENILGELRRLPFVKDFSVQSRFFRALMEDSETCPETEKSRGGSCNFSQISEGSFPKKNGKQFTTWTEQGEMVDCFDRPSLLNTRRKILLQRSQITSMFGAEKLWAKGFTGAKVRMAVFDTGVRADHPHFRNIKERTNWTNEDTLNDNLGHGTFVAGVISSQDPQCLGFAPDAEIFAFRVFTDAQVSYTSWFLDAFNYAIAINMNILNLSIGGPDFLDRPFIEKVWEMTANNVVMVSAIGNDGPLYGTLNNPADQSDVIGVGGIDYSDHIASFSSRGMTTWEIPHGYY